MDNPTGNYRTEDAWVTFCMTTYKRADFLKSQLQSFARQGFTRWRVIISDNDPEGSAKKVVETFDDPRVSYAINEVNLGMVKSFNRSLSKATTEWVVMITDDDPIYPDMLQTLYDLTVEYPGYGMYMGGCDIVYFNPTVARSSRMKVGANSCLAELPIGTVRTYTGKEFAFAYFGNQLNVHLLWSCGIVKREIAQAVGGMPDFGAPYNTDFGYIALSGSWSGTVLLNTSLGYQSVHGANYGFTESDFEKFYITPEGFCNWVMQHLRPDADFTGLRQKMEAFTGRWVVEYAMSIRKYIREKNAPADDFTKVARKIFRIPYLRKWKWKYYLAIYLPWAFPLLIRLKMKLFKNKD